MSWEALRLTSRTPSELLSVLGPQGVDELLRDARNACWREHPAEGRSVAAVKKTLAEVLERNLAAWNAIRKPTPEAFFANLLPHAADGHVRQALVLCYMMMPRGKRSVKLVGQVVRAMYERMVAAWEEDLRAMTKGVVGKAKAARAKAKTKRK